MIVWIASYPKSGSTWIRSLLSAYLFSNDGKFNFDLLKNIDQFTSKNLSDNSYDNTNYQNKISKNWLLAQEIINKDKKVHFLKTHNAMCTINGNKFTDKFNTLAAIYIVRDPRNLITSLAHHFEFSIDEAFSFLTNERKIIFPKDSIDQNTNQPQDFNFLGNWSGHYNSWKKINFCPVKIIKYEELLSDPKKSFISILNFISKFIKFKFEEKKIKNVIASTNFKTLRNLEKKEGFSESIISSKTKKKIKFFNLGKKNNWKTLLNNKTVKKIDKAFKKEMLELNYLH